MKATLSFFLFGPFFVVFFFFFFFFLIFLFIFALTFHKCQIVQKAILSFLFFALFSRCAGRRAALFSVGLFVCVFVCVFSSFRAFFGFLATTGGGGAEAYDSGRGADYRGGKGL